MASVPPPISLPSLIAPDRDFDSIRASAIDVVVEDAGATWTDHNLSDPGITFLEVLAWGLADLHYRTAARSFEQAPLEGRLWLDREDRDWFGIPDMGDPQRIVSLAALLATRVPPITGPTEAERMAGIVRGLNSRREAIGALADREFGDETPPRHLTWSEAAVVVALLRTPVIRRAALDASGLLAASWAEARRTVERRAAGGPIDEGKVDDEIVRLLGFEPSFSELWEDELRTLIRRHRHHIFLDTAAAFAPDVQAQPTIADIQSKLKLDVSDARAVLALHPCPTEATPETWEQADGATTTWPPHPLQVLTTEPITAEDYSTRARAAPRVRRAWTVPGALAGIAWDGSERPQADPNPKGKVTLLVEFDQVPPNANKRRAWMREVLAFVTAGAKEAAESELPYDHLIAPNLQMPRRVMCDELTVAKLEQCPVVLNGVIHVALGANRDKVRDDALARVEAWFAAGRRESAIPQEAAVPCSTGIDGPWPAVPQPEGGWIPGEAIRLHELVQVLAADPSVIGVEGVGANVDGTWHQIDDDETEAPLQVGCVPILPEDNEKQCLQVRLELGADCRG